MQARILAPLQTGCVVSKSQCSHLYDRLIVSVPRPVVWVKYSQIPLLTTPQCLPCSSEKKAESSPGPAQCSPIFSLTLSQFPAPPLPHSAPATLASLLLLKHLTISSPLAFALAVSPSAKPLLHISARLNPLLHSGLRLNVYPIRNAFSCHSPALFFFIAALFSMLCSIYLFIVYLLC